MATSKSKVKGPKPATVDPIPERRDDGAVVEFYEIARRLIGAHHPDLAGAKVIGYWQYNWPYGEDDDAEPRRVEADLTRERDWKLHGCDIQVGVNRSWWVDAATTGGEKEAYIDRALCGIALKLDKNDDPVVDEAGRMSYVKKGPDIAEYTANLARYGRYSDALRNLVPAGPAASDDGEE